MEFYGKNAPLIFQGAFFVFPRGTFWETQRLKWQMAPLPDKALVRFSTNPHEKIEENPKKGLHFSVGCAIIFP